MLPTSIMYRCANLVKIETTVKHLSLTVNPRLRKFCMYQVIILHVVYLAHLDGRPTL